MNLETLRNKLQEDLQNWSPNRKIRKLKAQVKLLTAENENMASLEENNKALIEYNVELKRSNKLLNNLNVLYLQQIKNYEIVYGKPNEKSLPLGKIDV